MSSTSSDQQKKSIPTGQAVQEATKPGPEHARLVKRAGTWKATATMWEKEGAAPVTSAGKAVFSLQLDGRYLREDYTGEFAGQTFQGVGTMAYDRAAGEFVNTWYDNMATGITRSAGTADGKQLVLTGEMTCPQRGRITLRQVQTDDTDDRFTVTMFNGKDGKETKTLEIVYTRQR